ncbi:MAG TPA: SulP family inorganic anion transporter [Egicoccus sp.]|nr:SulP family inorganic anion transporter [Egicoccus sp.]HSK22933.1 SulP family inorganic anion transporter [Egicoccus sp.]
MSGRAVLRRGRALLPRWATGYQRAWLRDDVVAGLTLTVMLVPQGMAYASLAGMPPITGLYAAIVSLLVYAALGTSSHLSFGPFALVALLSAAAVEPLADGDLTRYVALSGALALMVAALHLLLAAVRASAIVELISRPVIVGFTAAVGLVIALSQVRDLTGVDVGRSDRFTTALAAAVEALARPHGPTVAVGVGSIAILLLGRRLAPRVPAALIVVVGGIVLAALFDLGDGGVALVGTIPSGLPRPVVPAVGLGDLEALLAPAIVLAVICYAGNMSMGKAIAARTRERLDARRELVASGVANGAAGLVGGFPVSASFTRTVIVFAAGARTQLAGVVAAVCLVATLLVFTPVLEPLPRAVLGAIVVVAVTGLIDLAGARRILAVDRADGAVMAVTFGTTLLLGAEVGLAAGVLGHLAVHVARNMRPALVELGRVEGTTLYRSVARHPTVTARDGLILRVDGSLEFLNVQHVTGQIRDRVADQPEVDWVVLVASGITGLDTTGLDELHDLQQHLRDADVHLFLATMRGDQRKVVARGGLWEALMEVGCHPDIPSALAAAGVPAGHPVRRPAPDEVRPDTLL